MERVNRSGRIFWSLAVLGMVAVPAFRVAAAQDSYHPAAMPTAVAQASEQGTSAPVKDDLFAGTDIFAKGASDVTEITMDPDTLDLVGGKDGKRAHNMVLNVVRTYTYDKPGMYRMEDVDKFRDKLNTGDWHCSVHTRDLKTGNSTDVCNKRRSDGLAETAIITVSPKSLTFIHTIRRKSAEEPTGFLMMDSLGGLSALAELDPQSLIDMQNAMTHLQMLDSAELNAKMDAAMQQMKEAQKNFKFDQRLFRSEGAKDGQPKQPE